jgi:RHS repeat-associated protein
MWNNSHRVAKAQKQFPNYQEGLIVIWDDVGLKDIKSFDYKPFGELDGGDEPTKHGFATAEYDGESSCFAMGMRMYSAEFGRFLSVDPLFEVMPRHTPYHYSFNSPLVWKDPSGLIPENEKDRDRLMTVYLLDVGESAENYIVGVNEIDFDGSIVRATAALLFTKYLETISSPGKYNNPIEGDRTGDKGSGDNATYKFVRIEDVFDDAGNHIGTNYIYELTIPTSSGGNLNIPVSVAESSLGNGQSPTDVMDAFVGGINDILSADPTYFDNLFGRDISIVILHSSNVLIDGKKVVAKESWKLDANGNVIGSVLTFAGDILTGRKSEPYSDNFFGNKSGIYNWQNYAMIGHEFAHAIQRTLAGDDWKLYSDNIKEDYATNAENRLRSFYGHPLRYNKHEPNWKWFNKTFYPNTWGKYLKRGY